MSVNNSFFIKKLEQFETCYILFSVLTHMPYVECDEENGNDCVFFFSDEKKAEAAVTFYKDKRGVKVKTVKVPRKNLKPFVSGLYGIGINIVVLEEDEKVQMPLKLLAGEPDTEKLKNDKIPYMNPEVQLTTLYFLQEARRKVVRSDDEKKRLRDMEEEMSVNLFRSRFIIALDNTVEPEVNAEGKKNYKLPMVKTGDGSAFLPVYSDVAEFQKMNLRFKDMKFRLVPVPYKDVAKFIPATAKGISINPAGFDLVLTREQMEHLYKIYGGAL